MGILKEFVSNAGQLIKARVQAPANNTEVGLAQLNYTGVPDEAHEAIYPNWFFSSKLGQPRDIDARMIRDLSKSVWVQMVLNAFKKQIMAIEWDIVNAEDRKSVV